MPVSINAQELLLVESNGENLQTLDSQKQRMLDQAYPTISIEIKRMEEQLRDPKKSEKMIVGMIFEKLAIAEKQLRNPETDIQKSLKRIIEAAFKNSSLLIGTGQDLSSPDDVKVIFNANGEPEVVELFDMKISKRAYKTANKNKISQPKRSIEGLHEIVTIINLIIEGNTAFEIKPAERLSEKRMQERNKILVDLHKKVKEQNLKQKITISKHLKYVSYLAKGEEEEIVNPIKTIATKYGNFEAEIETSRFSRKDIYNIIDHYSETN